MSSTTSTRAAPPLHDASAAQDALLREQREGGGLDRRMAECRVDRGQHVAGEFYPAAQYHLSHVFTKLGISSRSQLDRVLPAGPDPDGPR
jgi:hypothetical protein